MYNFTIYVDEASNNRNMDSFSEEECWRDLRFRKEDINALMVACLIPPNIFIDDREVLVDGEYAFCIFLYRMHYPGTLASLQSVFGRDCNLWIFITKEK